MSQLTPNYNLILLEATDPLADFRAWYNATLTIIDNNLGGGGSGGHTIIDPNGTDMPSETGLQFTGNVTVTDDSVNGKTIVDIPAGSGSGHTIIDPSGTSMTQRSGLKFTGNVNVTDDSGNNETIVNVTGGGGSDIYSYTEQVIGTWVNNKPLYRITVPFNTGVVASNIDFNITSYMPADCIVQKSFHTIDFTYAGVTYHGANWGGSYLNMNGTHYFSFNIGSASYDKHIELTIEYTKTTD